MMGTETLRYRTSLLFGVTCECAKKITRTYTTQGVPFGFGQDSHGLTRTGANGFEFFWEVRI